MRSEKALGRAGGHRVSAFSIASCIVIDDQAPRPVTGTPSKVAWHLSSPRRGAEPLAGSGQPLLAVLLHPGGRHVSYGRYHAASKLGRIALTGSVAGAAGYSMEAYAHLF